MLVAFKDSKGEVHKISIGLLVSVALGKTILWLLVVALIAGLGNWLWHLFLFLITLWTVSTLIRDLVARKALG